MSQKRRKKTVGKRKTRIPLGQYKSALEVRIAKDIAKKCGKVKVSYETKALPYTLSKNYYPDFVCVRADGTTFYIEVKGYFRPEDRTKLRAATQREPRPDVRLLFQVDNRLSARSTSRYSDWCKRHGFLYAIKDPPDEWFQT